MAVVRDSRDFHRSGQLIQKRLTQAGYSVIRNERKKGFQASKFRAP